MRLLLIWWLVAEASRPLVDGQTIIVLLTIVISLTTLVLTSNDRRRRSDHEEITELTAENTGLTKENKRLQAERDELERKYYNALEDLRRLNVKANRE